MAIDSLLAGILLFNLAQFGLLWYKMGKLESRLIEHCKEAKK